MSLKLSLGSCLLASLICQTSCSVSQGNVAMMRFCQDELSRSKLAAARRSSGSTPASAASTPMALYFPSSLRRALLPWGYKPLPRTSKKSSIDRLVPLSVKMVLPSPEAAAAPRLTPANCFRLLP